MASSSVSQDDHDIEHEFAIASRRAKVRSARANRTINSLSCRGLGEDLERDVEGGGGGGTGDYHHHQHHIPKYDQQASVVLVESNDASPKPVIRGLNKEKRSIPRGAHASHASSKSNKGIRDRRKLREKRRSTASVMHVPSTESTGGSTGEDENEENSVPGMAAISKVVPVTAAEPEVQVQQQQQVIHNKGKSESDLDADDEAAQDSSEVKIHGKDDTILLKLENQRLKEIVDAKDRRISMLEIQVAQLSKQLDEIKEKLLISVKTSEKT